MSNIGFWVSVLPFIVSLLSHGFMGTKSFNKKDALMKLNFDNLFVVGETKLKQQLKALVFSFHLRGRAAL